VVYSFKTKKKSGQMGIVITGASRFFLMTHEIKYVASRFKCFTYLYICLLYLSGF